MRRIAFSMLALVAVVGCSDPAASGAAANRGELAAAIGDFDDAAVGFAPGDTANGSNDHAALLTKAAGQLDGVARNGSDLQKTGAAQLQADAAAYAASRALIDAARNAATLESATLSMVTDIEIIAEIEGRIARLSVSEDKLIEQLREGVEGVPASGLKVVSQTISELNKVQSDLKSQAAARQRAVDALEKELASVRAEAQRTRTQAFAAEGAAKADLQFRAAGLDRQIEAIESKLNKAVAELNAVTAELQLVDMRVESQEQVASELRESIKTVQDRTAQREKDLQEQKALRDQAVADLIKSIEEHVSEFDSSVSRTFTEAATRLGEAIAKISSARAVGKLIPPTSLKLDELGKRALLSEVHSRRAAALAGLVQTIDVLNSNLSEESQAAPKIREIVEPLRTELDRAAGDTDITVDDGLRLANELETQFSESDPARSNVQTLIASLDASKARAESARAFAETR